MANNYFPEPIAPQVEWFTDEDGCVDHYEYGMALDDYEANHAAWYAEVGYIREQVEQAWSRREAERASATV